MEIWLLRNFVTETSDIYKDPVNLLKGFFNLIIFVYHKAGMLLRSDEDMTLAEAKYIFESGKGDSVRIV